MAPHAKSVIANNAAGNTPTYVKPYASKAVTAKKRNSASQ
jgi:hypothetical protein